MSAYLRVGACFVLAVGCNGTLSVDTGREPSVDSAVIPGDGSIADTASTDAPADVPQDAPAESDGSFIQPMCVNDADCKLPSLHCETRSGQCVACLYDSHCPTKERKRCDAALHRCVECGLDADCKANEVCEPISRRCVTKCGGSLVCPAPAKCDDVRSICITCTDDGACDKRHCEVASGRCFDCTRDDQCPPDKKCDTVLGKCVVCVTSSDCPASKRFCDPLTDNCTAG